MDKNQVALVQNTWVQVTPHADAAAALFYQRLFDANPEYRALFSGDMREQGLKLMQMLGTVVAGLHDVENLIPTVQDLGRRHEGYGVAAVDYEAVGAARQRAAQGVPVERDEGLVAVPQQHLPAAAADRGLGPDLHRRRR